MRYAPGLLFVVSAILVALQASAQTSDRSLNADGTTSMRYFGHLADLDTQLGLDMSTVKTSAVPMPQAEEDAVNGTVFANVSLQALPEWLLWQKGSVNVAVSPTDEESRLGTTLSRTWTINDGLKAELAGNYEVGRSNAASGWKMDETLSLKSLDTGTTISVGTSADAQGARLLPFIGAQQKVLGALRVMTRLADTGTDFKKSITAGFSHRW